MRVGVSTSHPRHPRFHHPEPAAEPAAPPATSQCSLLSMLPHSLTLNHSLSDSLTRPRSLLRTPLPMGYTRLDSLPHSLLPSPPLKSRHPIYVSNLSSTVAEACVTRRGGWVVSVADDARVVSRGSWCRLQRCNARTAATQSASRNGLKGKPREATRSRLKAGLPMVPKETLQTLVGVTAELSPRRR